MKSYRYVKVSPVTITVPVLPFLSFVIGASLLVWVIGPILSFAFFFRGTAVVTPLSDEAMRQASQVTNNIDFSKANSWFPKNSAEKIVTPVDAYTLSIPKLRIEKALVRIGTDDLSKNLIHYGGSGLPGSEGNAVIFGHSVLPSFYDPKNYMTIFSLLPNLKEGDDIFVHYDGVDYRYEVMDYRVTTPSDVTGLEQSYDDSYITLVTCVPPGTYLSRLWLKAVRKPFGIAAATNENTRN